MSFDFLLTENGITVDLSVLKDLVGDDIDSIRSIIELFLTTMPPSIEKMKQYDDQKDWENLFKTAHTVKSSVSVIKVSSSYALSATYYFDTADDLLGGTIGYGLSPDDRYFAIQFYKLTTYKAGIFYKKKISRFNVLSASASWANQEYLPETKGNQYQIGVSWLHRF